MVSKVFFLVVASLCVYYAAADESVVDTLKDDVTKTVEKAKEIGEHISKMLGIENLPAGEELVNIIKTQAKSFADKAEVVQKQIDEELKKLTNSEVSEHLQEFSKKLQDTVSTFRHQIETSPVTEKAAELQGKFQDGLTNLFEESKKAVLSMEPQVIEAGKEIEKLTKTVLDEAVENLTQLEGKLHTATGHKP